MPLLEETLMAISLALIIILGLGADYLFRRWKLRRFAEVDSEILFRLALCG